jgi:hypothetical protein
MRSNLGLQRLKIRTKEIAAVERALLPLVNLELAGIADVQTSSDRLDPLQGTILQVYASEGKFVLSCV